MTSKSGRVVDADCIADYVPAPSCDVGTPRQSVYDVLLEARKNNRWWCKPFGECDGRGDIAVPGYKGMYTRAFIWQILLLSNWFLTRATCRWGVPYDCNLTNDSLAIMDDVQIMFNYGLVMGWFCGIYDSERFWHLFSPARWWFYVVFYASGVIFSIVSSLPMFQTSLSSGESWTGWQITLFIVLFIAVKVIVIWHFVYAYKLFNRLGEPNNFYMYLATRLGTAAYFGIYSIIIATSGVNFEYHHYWVCWVASLFCQFQHGLSLLWLACTAGIFVQGLGAYRATFLFYEQ